MGAIMANQKTDPRMMKIADQAFWDEFNKTDKSADRYIVIDSKDQKVIGQTLRLVMEKKKVRV